MEDCGKKHSFGFGSKIGRTGMEEMSDWRTEKWQNINLLVIRRLKMKGLIFFNCHALANTGPFVANMLRLFGLAFSLSTSYGLYAVIVEHWMRIVSFYHDCPFHFLFFLFHLNLSYCSPPK